MFIAFAILIFGVLIAVHELGHFLAAKACGVRVLEFALGMGPKIFKKQGEETLYTLRLLPIGGFCAMEGEDEGSDDPRAFTNQSFVKRLIILLAGSLMNFLFGVIVIAFLFSGVEGFSSPEIGGFMENCPYDSPSGLMEGDTFYKIDGHRIYSAGNVSMFLERAGGEPVDLVVLRDGKKVALENYPLQLREYVSDGVTSMKYGLYFNPAPATLGNKAKYTMYYAADFVRLIWISFGDLFGGAVGVKDLSGPVGIVDVMNDYGQQAASVQDGIYDILYFSAFIAINLAVMNLMPIPALDGGRIFFMIINLIIIAVFKKKPDPKYEGYIHAVFLIALMGLMVFVMFNDIARIISV